MRFLLGSRASLSLFLAGLGWGATGIFVRLLGAEGLSSYELLFVRLVTAGFVLLPIIFIVNFKKKRSPLDTANASDEKPGHRGVILLGAFMVLYYLGAITAFLYLPVVVAALIIGSSPVLAWALAYRENTSSKAGLGVGLATLGLIMLAIDHFLTNKERHGDESFELTLLGFLSAVMASLITVINARRLKRLGPLAPNPIHISLVTVLIGSAVSSFLVSDFHTVFATVRENLGLVLGFGIFATALPGLAIAYASARLKPQATSTVSIQLQVWTGIFGWMFLNEHLSGIQIVAAIFAIGGSWICTVSKA